MITKNKNALLITMLALIACALHAAILQTAFSYYAVTSAAKVIIFILCPIIYFRVVREGKFKDLLLMFWISDKKAMKPAFILGACVFALIVAGFIFMRPFFDSAMVTDALAANGITAGNAIFVFIYIVLINAALEQLFFRGFVFMQIHRMGFKRYAHVYSAVLFSVYHIPIIFHAVSWGILILCTIGLIAAGLIFNALALKCKSLSGSLCVHISANLALNLMVGVYFVFVQ